MFTTLLILVFAIIYAKPIYWLGKMTYIYYKYHEEQGIAIEHPLVTEYRNKLYSWFSQAWAIIKWQKIDL